MRVQLDEEVLRNIALKTGAEYFYAGNAQDLKQVYQRLSSRLTAEKKETEITGSPRPDGRSLLYLGVGPIGCLVQSRVVVCLGRSAYRPSAPTSLLSRLLPPQQKSPSVPDHRFQTSRRRPESNPCFPARPATDLPSAVSNGQVAPVAPA